MYSNEQYEAIYRQTWEEKPRSLESLGSRQIPGYRVKTIRSGQMLECEIYPLWNTRQAAGRAKKCRPSRKAQENLNDKNARKWIVRLINTNFTQRDLWMTLTCDDQHLPEDDEAAEKMIRNFIRRIQYRRKKRRLSSLRYVYVVEHREGTKTNPGIRYHFHLILSGDMDRDELEQMWMGGGRREAHRLQPDECGLEGLARYITKAKKGKRRWGSSKNLKKPLITIADHKVRRKHAENIARNENLAPEYFERLYPGYWFHDVKIFRSQYVAGVYLYVRMRRLQ